MVWWKKNPTNLDFHSGLLNQGVEAELFRAELSAFFLSTQKGGKERKRDTQLALRARRAAHNA